MKRSTIEDVLRRFQIPRLADIGRVTGRSVRITEIETDPPARKRHQDLRNLRRVGHASIAITERAYIATTLTQPNLAGP